MEPFRNKLVKIINEARTNPKYAGQQLFNHLSPHYQNNQLHVFNKHIDTFEGIDALNDYVKFMSNQKSVGYLQLSDALCLSAQAIAQEKGRNGRSDHENPQQIYRKICMFGTVEGSIGQLVALKTHSSQQIAAYFLVDDGLFSRKRRRMLLDSKYKYIGVGTARHINHEIIIIILLAQNIKDLKQNYFPESPIKDNNYR